MQTLGIIGGMGPAATVMMFQELVERTCAARDQEHLDILIYNHASIPDRTEAIASGHAEELIRCLRADAQMLERCGAGVIAIPCNTSHRFYDDIQSAVSIPVLNMIGETVARLRRDHPSVQKVGILATDGTVNTGLYHKACAEAGIDCITPPPEVQRIVMRIIYEQIKAGESGNLEDFELIDRFLKKEGCEAAILACTELSVFRSRHELSRFYVDAMTALIDASILACGAAIKEEWQ